ncbi:restriction endonuclease subunit S [Vibrio fluvialis]|uniref:restriction endonuclease subunit S n=1 Tax=Vibrio fluvialis TaxID=676 RepID=UPI00192B83D4|nr:restriction endonuclease subunit S [Vibrio fluvialis]MBL4283165.1 restriction endonuclease subunit S [Vibrio fluvialis]
MGSDWIELTIEELASPEKSSLSTGPFGSAISAKFFQEEGVPVIRGSNLSTQTSEKMNDDGLVFVSEEKASEFKRSIVRSGDLIFTCWGTINQVGLITEECKYSEYIISNKQMKATLDKTKADPLFVYYYFSSPIKQKEIIQNGIGAAVPGFNLGQLKQHKLRLPSLTEQKKISSFLGLLDTKITLNRQINQTLEQMTQTLFKSWFVDFDPVIDNALDAGNAIPDELQARAEQRQALRHAVDETNAANQPQSTRTNPAAGDALASPYKPLPDDIRQLFPNEFEESELGWVPKGWGVGSLSDIASYTSDRVSTEDLTLSNYISTENMLVDKKGVVDAANLPTVKTVPAYVNGNVLISNIRPYFKKIWMANGRGGHSNDVLGFVTKVKYTEEYLFNLLYQDVLFDFMLATSKGSKMPRGDKKAILNWQIVLAPISLRTYFSNIVREFYVSASARHKENTTLTNLRDTLLPKLISGELRLDEVESTIAETTA